MSSSRAINVLLAGLLVMVASAFGGYWWASSADRDAQITPRRKAEQPEEPSIEEETETTRTDTESLTPSNWEAFLEYEGKRSRMLGIKKNYSTINFRSGPGTEFSIVQTPSGGILLLPLDRVGEWYRARMRDGTIGWIHRSLVRVLQAPQPIFTAFQDDLPPLEESSRDLIPEEFQDHNRVRILETKINFRQGPGVQFPSAGQLYKHQEVRLMGKRKDWFRVRNRYGSTGWIREDLGEIVWKTDPEEQPEIDIKTRELRMGPEFQFRKPTPSEKAITVTLLEENAPWYMVQLDDEIGWVHEREITKDSQPPTE